MEPERNRDGVREGTDAALTPVDDARPVSVEAVHRAVDPSLSPSEAIEVDARQDELMAMDSAEGQPPTHRQRMSGWKWFAILIPLILVGSALVAVMKGASVMAVAQFGIVFALLLLIGGLPRWAASLSRGKEEANARTEAVAELHPDKATESSARVVEG